MLVCRKTLSSNQTDDGYLYQEMEKAQAKGEIAEEELRALEMDVTGKVRMIKSHLKSDTYSSICRSCLLRGEVRDWKSVRSSARSWTTY